MAIPTQERFVLRNSAGTFISLSGPIYVLDHAGLGLVKPERAARSGPYQHGQTLANARLGPRTITLKLAIQADTEADVWVASQALEQIFNQLDAAIFLDVTRPDTETRRLRVAHGDGWTLPRKASDVYNQIPDVLQLVADDPIAYVNEWRVITLGVGVGGTGTPVPTLVPMSVGASAIDETKTETYRGTWFSLPIVRFTGPLVDPVLENLTTEEKLDLTSVTLSGGEWIEIDCRYGYKTAVDESGNNRLEDLTTDSDLATFHLAPADEATNGVNEFRATATGATSGSRITIRYLQFYQGVL